MGRSSKEIATGLRAVVALLCILALGSFGSAGSQPQEHALPINPKTSLDVMTVAAQRKAAPDFTLIDSNGKPLALSGLKGKVVLLNFWATWCGGCKYEMPWYAEFHDKYAKQGLTVVGVSMDEDMQTAQAYLKQKSVPYSTVLGSDALGKRFDLGPMPLTLLIDQQGRVAIRHSGVVDKNDFEMHIQQLLRS